MSIDIEELTPAPWAGKDDWDNTTHTCWSVLKDSADMQFIALARTDLDVQMRRGWHVEKCVESDQWLVPQLVAAVMKYDGEKPFRAGIDVIYQDHHPVGLLTKADKWAREHGL